LANCTPFSALLGGVLIGLGATLLLVANGRVAGISGISGGLLEDNPGDRGWRAAFLAGLGVGGMVLLWLRPESFPTALHGNLPRSAGALAVAGLLVGFGTRLGSGCTSGHGVCGISRGSARSLAATATFMLTAGVTVFVVRTVFGGAL
jgi:uncharacterized membrane protein YedE/YeeE